MLTKSFSKKYLPFNYQSILYSILNGSYKFFASCVYNAKCFHVGNKERVQIPLCDARVCSANEPLVSQMVLLK